MKNGPPNDPEFDDKPSNDDKPKQDMFSEKEDERLIQKLEDEDWMDVLSELMEKDIDNLSFEENLLLLQLTVNNETQYGRKLAIKELINDEYKILDDEYANPHKEIINKSLLYLSGYYVMIDKKRAVNYMRYHFPIMGKYIFRYIAKEFPNSGIKLKNIPPENIDEQKAYQEFLAFTCLLFNQRYPNKAHRNEMIRREIKILGSSLISIIENEDKEDKKQ